MKLIVRAAIATIAVGGFFSVPISSYALTTLRVSANSGVSWVTIADTDTVSFDGSIGASGWSVLATGNAGTGTLEEPVMNLLNATVTSTRSGTLLIELSETGFGPFPVNNSFRTVLGSHNEDLLRATTTFWSYAGLGSGGLFEKSTLLGVTSQRIGLSESAESEDGRVGIPDYIPPQQYSLTMVISVFHSGAGVSTFDARLIDDPATVPESGTTFVLLGLAFLVVVGCKLQISTARQ